MRSVPYAAIRIVAGLLAVGWSLYQLLSEGSWLGGLVGVVAFFVGWFIARRFARPARRDRPWLDTLLPIAVAAFAIAPAVAYPLIGKISFAVTAADFVLLFAGVSLSLASGPYANEKVALAR